MAMSETGEIEESILTLGNELKSKYEEYKDARSDIEDEWIEDLRAFMGKYDPETTPHSREGDRSQVYVVYPNKSNSGLLKNHRPFISTRPKILFYSGNTNC